MALEQGYKQLRQTANTFGLSGDGLQFLIHAMDPYHDRPVQLTGIPDRYNGHTLCRSIKKSISIAKPAGFVKDFPDTSWNVRVDLLPTLTPFVVIPVGWNGLGNHMHFYFDHQSGEFADGDILATVIDPLQITYYQNSFEPWPHPENSVVGWQGVYRHTAEPAGGYKNIREGLNIGLEFVGNGMHRLLGCGFEIEETTPVIDQTGLITCYRIPDYNYTDKSDICLTHTNTGMSEWNNSTFATTDSATWQTLERFPLPPPRVQDLMLLPATRQWKARHGAYCVQKLGPQRIGKFESWQNSGLYYAANCDSTEFTEIKPNEDSLAWADYHPAYMVNSIIDVMRTVRRDLTGTNPAVTQPPRFLEGADNLDKLNANYFHNYNYYKILRTSGDIVGVVIEGLGDKSKFNLNVKWDIETQPFFNDKDIVLAQSSAQYSPEAMELYFRATEFFPPGVYRSMNPLGEWFNKAMDWIQSVAVGAGTAIGSFFGMPGVGAGVGGVISAGAGLGLHLNTMDI